MNKFLSIYLKKKTPDQEIFTGINFLEHKHAPVKAHAKPKPRLGVTVCQALDIHKGMSILP